MAVSVKAPLLILGPTLSPVTVIPAATPAVTTATSSPVSTAATAGLDATSLDIPNLLFTVVLLALDYQLLSLPLGLGIQRKELLLSLFRIKLDKDTALEDLVGGTAEANGIRRTVRREERFNIELSAGFLPSETLGVGATAHGLVFKDLDHRRVVCVFHRLREGNLAAYAGVIVRQLQNLRRLESLDNSAERLKTAHALERVKEGEGYRTVLAAAHLGQEELIHWEVGIREVELNLWELVSTVLDTSAI